MCVSACEGFCLCVCVYGVSHVLCGQLECDLIAACVYETQYRGIKNGEAILYGNNQSSAEQTQVCLYN